MVNNLLQNSFMFRLFSAEEIDKLASIAELVRYEQGQEVFVQNENSNSMFFIKYGSIRITYRTDTGDEVSVAVLGTGSHFGEMAYFDSSRRAGSAQVLEHTEVVRIDFDRLKGLFEAFPTLASKFHQAVAQSLASRLRLTTRDLGHSKARNTLPL